MIEELRRAEQLTAQLLETRDQIKSMLGPKKWAETLAEFRPYLARLAGEKADWLGATIELCKRMKADHAPGMTLAKCLAAGAEFSERNETP